MPITEKDIVEVAAETKREEDLRNEIASLFREFRFERGWTQREAASHLRISQQNIPRLEKGMQDMKLSTLQRLAYGYGYKVEVSFVPIEE